MASDVIFHDWRTRAACAGTDPNDWVWINSNKIKDTRKAAKLKAICDGCPVRQPCLDAELDAMRNGEASYGVFGGTDANERRVMLGKNRSNHQPTPIVHGTMAGYVKHNRYPHIFAEPCADCRTAYNQRRTELKQQQRARRIRTGVTDWITRDHPPLTVIEGGAA